MSTSFLTGFTIIMLTALQFYFVVTFYGNHVEQGKNITVDCPNTPVAIVEGKPKIATGEGVVITFESIVESDANRLPEELSLLDCK